MMTITVAGVILIAVLAAVHLYDPDSGRRARARYLLRLLILRGRR